MAGAVEVPDPHIADAGEVDTAAGGIHRAGQLLKQSIDALDVAV